MTRSPQGRLFPTSSLDPGHGLGPRQGYRRPPPSMTPQEDDWQAWLAQTPAFAPAWTTRGTCRCGEPADLDFDQELPETCVACAETKE